MCTAVPPPSPPRPPKYVPKDPPTPPKPTVHGPYSAKTLQLIRDNHGGGVQYFVDGVLNCRAMYRFAVQQPKKNPLRVWQEGLRISRSHFLNRDEEHAAVVLEVLCATPKHPPIPKPPPQPVPRRPPPPRARDQVTLTQYVRHRRSSLLPMAPAPKRPCPTPQFGSLLGPPSQSAPPPRRGPSLGHCSLRKPPRSLARCSRGEPLSPPPNRRGPSLGHCSLRKPPRSDPRLRRDGPISSSSATPEEVDLYGVFQHHQPVGHELPSLCLLCLWQGADSRAHFGPLDLEAG